MPSSLRNIYIIFKVSGYDKWCIYGSLKKQKNKKHFSWPAGGPWDSERFYDQVDWIRMEMQQIWLGKYPENVNLILKKKDSVHLS